MRAPLSRFLKNESGAVMVEAVIVLPLMIWAYLALFVYWDAYRSINTSQKAAYTISDMLSREMITLPANYVTGMRDLMSYLVDDDQTVKIRVTSVTWSEINNRFEVDWSRSPDNAFPQLTTSSIQSLAPRIPALADGPGRPPMRVVSINLCTDQLAMMLAAPGQLVSVSHLATEEQSSSMVDEARAYPANRGQVEQVFLMQRSLLLAVKKIIILCFRGVFFLLNISLDRTLSVRTTRITCGSGHGRSTA